MAKAKPRKVRKTGNTRVSGPRSNTKLKTPKLKTVQIKRDSVGARALKIVELLLHYYGDAKCSLDAESPFQLLIATALSAQCTDERVNKVTPGLFARCRTPQAFVDIGQTELEGLIRSTGFYKNKAKNIKACAQELVTKYDSEVPRTMEELSALAGVGRKTANVVLGNAFRIPGMVVDTHVLRLSNRLGLVRSENPVVIERELEKLIPKEHWIAFSHWLIAHGRKICKARSPQCETCFLVELCPQIGVARS